MNFKKKNFYERFFKRPIDILFAFILLITLSPIFIIVGLLVRVKLGSPVIFKQDRPGLNEKMFKMYKFRTMTNEKDEYGILLPDSKRLTRFGRFLRSTSLDELPELINILKGDMSFIGPRPLLVQYLPLYNNRQRKRHKVRPGLSGLAQVSGRNTLDWEKRFDLDVYYVENVSFVRDVKIILQTIKKVFIQEGISSKTSSTMEPFKGTNRKKEEL
ncbi:sugar transferase [Shouchella clausii]|uniref:sugar transferase n=1 Tax=Shouchella clausii TaxID=79880 RepID=UPI000BA610C0|nr:sugar transferase [Shouchella clausii]PAE96546.1 sugar transferase [Shouchella clausii]